MSDYCGAALSTSFRVRDEKVFLADPEVEALKDRAHGCGAMGFFAQENDYWAFGWIDMYPDRVTDSEDEWINIPAVIRRHIVPGDVCKIVVSGHEKLRFVGGPVWYVSSDEILRIDAGTTYDNRLTLEHLKRIVVHRRAT